MLRRLGLFLLASTVACGDGNGDVGGTLGSSGVDGSESAGSTGGRGSTGSAVVGDFAQGEIYFLETCGRDTCHGPDGRNGPAPNLASAVPARDDEELSEVITVGVPGIGASPGMPGLEPSEQELADVLVYLRATFPG